MDEKEIHKLFVSLEKINMQIERLISDIDSEKESRRRRNDAFDKMNDEFDRRIRTLEDWKSETKGKVSIVNVIVMAVISLAIYIILWLITKK